MLDLLGGESIEEALSGGKEERPRDVVGDVHAILRELSVDDNSVGRIPGVDKDGNEDAANNGNGEVEDKGHSSDEKHDEDITALDLVVEVDHVTDTLWEECGDAVEQRSPLNEGEEADVEHDTGKGGEGDVLNGGGGTDDNDKESDTREEGGKTSDTIRLVGYHGLSDHTRSPHTAEDTGNDVADALAHSDAVLHAIVADAIVENIGGQKRFDQTNAKDSKAGEVDLLERVPGESGHVNGGVRPNNLGEGGGNVSVILNEGRLVANLSDDGPLGNHTNNESDECAGDLLGGLGKEDADEEANESLGEENDEGGRADPLGILIGEVSPGVTDLDKIAATLKVLVVGLVGPNLGIAELLGGDEQTHGIDESNHDRVGNEAHESSQAHEAKGQLKDAGEHDGVEDVVNAVFLNNLEKGKANETGSAGDHTGAAAADGGDDVHDPGGLESTDGVDASHESSRGNLRNLSDANYVKRGNRRKGQGKASKKVRWNFLVIGRASDDDCHISSFRPVNILKRQQQLDLPVIPLAICSLLRASQLPQRPVNSRRPEGRSGFQRQLRPPTSYSYSAPLR